MRIRAARCVSVVPAPRHALLTTTTSPEPSIRLAGGRPPTARTGAETIQQADAFRAGAMIRLADEAATAAAMPRGNPAGEYRPARCPSIRDMSAHMIRHTNDDPGVDSATCVDGDGLDASLDRRGRARRPIVALATTRLVPDSPAVTSPTDHRRR
jgi:hypothetical protein